MMARKKAPTKKPAPAKRAPRKRARKKEEEDVEEGSSFELPIEAETLRGVWAVLSIALGVFFLLAWFGFAGKLGTQLYLWLSALFGVGYVLVPISFGMLAAILFQSFDKEKIGSMKIIGTGIFFLAGLGFVETLFPERGGLIGQIISGPLTYSIDTIATVVVLLALIVTSLLVAFDVRIQRAFPTVMKLFGHDPYADENQEEQVLDETEKEHLDAQALAHEEEEYEEEEPAEAPKKAPGIFNFGGATEEPSIFNFATGGNGAYSPPPLSLLQKDKGKPSVGDVKASANTIKRTLQNFGISVEMDEVSIGPTVTQYAMKPAEGVRLAKIVGLQSNLELALAATPIRIEAPIPGKSLVGIEVPNTVKAKLGLGSLLSTKEFQSSGKPLNVALGRDIAGSPHFADIANMPHILIAGATGAGKSVTVNNLIVSLLYKNGPKDLRFVMIDPKRVELTLYNAIPHLLTPVITDPKKAILALKWLAKEMDRRYNILEAESVRDIASYHKNIYDPAVAKAQKKDSSDENTESSLPEPMPHIVTVIDELADLMQAYPRELEAAIVRLAQMSRAVGIHLVLSTQRPSVQVVTGLIKANIPTRLALQVASQVDSKTILDGVGAEKLLGAGDSLYQGRDMSKPRRIQAPYVSEEEVKDVVKYLAESHIDELPDEIDLTEVGNDNGLFAGSVGGGFNDDDGDDLYEDAKRVIIEAGKGSTSFLQRKLRVGYARAARLMDMLEERGVVGPADGSKPRDVIAENRESVSYEDDGDDDSYDDSDDDEENDTTDEDDEEYENART